MPTSADVVVVGGGYAGMAAARELADRGQQVVVVEKEAIGWLASTRNGGMVIPELKAGPRALEREYGPVGRRMYAEVNEAFDHVEALVGRRRNRLRLRADRPALPRPLAPPRSGAAGDGARARHRARRAGRGTSPATSCPTRSARPSSTAVSSSNAPVGSSRRRSTEVWCVERSMPAPRCTTTPRRWPSSIDRAGRVAGSSRRRGSIDARVVIVFTNAYADGLLPCLQRSVLPVGSFIIATEVLDPQVAEAVSPRRRMLVDTKNFLFYWRLTPDGRMAFGGRRSFARTSLTQAREFLGEQLVRVHPATRRREGRVRVGRQRGDHLRPLAPRRLDRWRVVRHRVQRIGRCDEHLDGSASGPGGVRRRRPTGVQRAASSAHPRVAAAEPLPAARRPWYRHQDTR